MKTLIFDAFQPWHQPDESKEMTKREEDFGLTMRIDEVGVVATSNRKPPLRTSDSLRAGGRESVGNFGNVTAGGHLEYFKLSAR